MKSRGLFLCAVIALAALSLPARADISEARAATGQYKAEMQASADAAAKNDAKSASSHAASARKYLKSACESFAAAGAGKSDDMAVLRDYANALIQNEDFDLAAEVLQQAVGIDPKDPALWLSMGYALSELGSPKANDAAAAFHKVNPSLASPDAVAAACLGLGELYRRESLHDLSAESYAKALEVKPDFRPAKVALAAARIRKGEILEASNDLDALGALSNEEGSILAENLPEALRGFELARLTFPDTAEHHQAYAKLLLRAGHSTKALAAVERSAMLNSGDYVTWNLIGGLSRQLDNPKRAKEAYTKSLEINADQPRTREALAAVEKG